MQVNEVRLGFVQFAAAADALRSFGPSIPFGFLVDGGKYATEFESVRHRPGQCRTPWFSGYGVRFWASYVEQKQTAPPAKEYWEHLVPFEYAEEPVLEAPWLKGNARARMYLYPWGVGALIDVSLKEPKELDAAVNDVVAIRNGRVFSINSSGGKEAGGVDFLLGLLCNRARGVAFGAQAQGGECSEVFTNVTVLDADGVNPQEPVADGGAIHQALYGFARGVKNWKGAKLEPLANSTVATGPAAAGSVLFATKHGRAVWYSDSFRSAGDGFKNSLRCYHQNLTAATLQTDALGILANDAAKWIGAGKPHGTWPTNYDQCARNGAGSLGRLQGGKSTYRSQSVARQIEGLYGDSLKALRTEYGWK